MRGSSTSLLPIRGKRRGQVLTEFIMVATMILMFCIMLVLFLAIFSEWNWRVLNLIGLEYP